MLQALIILAVAMLVISLIWKHGILFFSAAAAWVILGVYSYTNSLTPGGGIWDVYYALFWMSMAMTLACAFLPLVTRPKKQEEQGDIQLSELEQTEKDYEDMLESTRLPRLRRRPRPRGMEERYRNKTRPGGEQGGR